MEFGSTLSVGDFKERVDATQLKVLKNPKTNKLFVSANGKIVAAVSKNYDEEQPKEFIELKIEGKNGEEISLWCLHNENEDNLVETL